ncbi:MAG: GNAT family N-acetyltransferase, partial [Betaproteobacteria bacterium]|nr:GNAT family N-acetyltransferase [Betaproteobacteria bacterium]
MQLQWSFNDSNFWADFHRQQDGTLQQAWDYGAALEQLGISIQRALVRDADGTPMAAAQFICRRMAFYLNLASCSRGPLWSPALDGQTRAQVLRQLRKTLPVGALRVPLFS